MKTTILSLVFLACATAFASPQVVCEPMYAKKTASGATGDYKIGEPIAVAKQESTNSLKGFQIQSRLERVCAYDGGPCGDFYTLHVSVRKGESQSMLITDVDGAQGKNVRYSTSLIVGKESVFINCDVQ